MPCFHNKPVQINVRLCVVTHRIELSVCQLTDKFRPAVTHNVVNCVIGGDVNTDISRIKSGNMISLQNFIEKENLFLAINDVINTVTHTYTGMNNTSSLIDHFIMSENMCLLANNYYTMDSVDNLSDHVPLFIVVNCFVETVPIELVKIASRAPCGEKPVVVIFSSISWN